MIGSGNQSTQEHADATHRSEAKSNNETPRLDSSPLPQTVEQARQAHMEAIGRFRVSGELDPVFDTCDALIAACRAEAKAPLQATIDRLVSINSRLEQQLAEAHAEIERLKKLQAQTRVVWTPDAGLGA